MLVQKVALSKTMKIILIASGALLVIIGGVFAYSKFFTSGSDETDTDEQAIVAPRQTIPTFDEKFFDDPRIYGLSKQNFSGFTNQYEGIALSDQQPLPPLSVRVESPSGGRMLLVSWQLPQHVNFSKVSVYRSEDISYLGDVVSTIEVAAGDANKNQTYLDTGLTNKRAYYYRIRTVNAAGQESAIQEAVSAVPTDTIPPDAPADVQIKAIGDRQVEVSWINPTSSDFTVIRVYRSAQRGLLGTIIYDDGTGDQSASDSTRSTYLDQGLAENIPYYYTVTSVDADGNESSTDLLAIPSRSGSYNPFEPITF